MSTNQVKPLEKDDTPHSMLAGPWFASLENVSILDQNHQDKSDFLLIQNSATANDQEK
jgi:hypothetical protein